MVLSVDIEKTLGDFHLRVRFEAEREIMALLGASGSVSYTHLKYININSIYSKNIVIKKANYKYHLTTLKYRHL